MTYDETPSGSYTPINYTYDSVWRDKLISYGNNDITYDEIGNPETYRDGMSFTWQGRQMKSANLNGTAVTYTYDADGLRTTKQVGSTLYEYEYVGGQLVYEKRGDIRFYYRYDALGQLASIKRINAAGTTYTVYAVTNSRGDIEELRHLNGSLIARYTYDTWGNTISIVDANGNEITSSTALPVQNPFRYRGYYYDSETGLYYLQSRYYDPVTCRFVNADALLNTRDVQGCNVFIYCINDPVNYVDHTGFCYKTQDGRWISCETNNYVSLNKIDPNDYDDDSYYNNNDQLRGRDSKRREKKQIDTIFGKRKDSEKERRELHDGKRKSGKRNNTNFPNEDLKNHNFYNSVILVGGSAIILWAVFNDASAIGVLDNVFILPTMDFIRKVAFN